MTSVSQIWAILTISEKNFNIISYVYVHGNDL